MEQDPLKQLNSLSDEEFKRLKIVMYEVLYVQNHRCDSNPQALVKCCEEFRCTTCHVKHLNKDHTQWERSFWFKNPGPQSGYKELKEPSPKKKSNESRKMSAVDMFYKMSPEEKARIKAILKGNSDDQD